MNLLESCNSCRVSVVMCSLNEQNAIAKLAPKIRRVIGKTGEIILVDSSTDATAKIAESFGIRVIRQIPLRGYDLAMMQGLLAAKGEVVVTMDCDNTYPPSKIIDMVEIIESGEADIVGATRMRKKQKAMPLLNYFANLLFAFLMHLIMGIPTTDATTGMRAYRKRIFPELSWDTELVLPIALLASVREKKLQYKEIPIDYYPRVGKVTLNRFRSGLASLLYILVRRWWRPKFFSKEAYDIMKN